MRRQIEALQKDVDTIRNLLQILASGKPPVDIHAADAAEPPPVQTLRIAGRSAVGSPSAPVVVLEFTDYECPYCAQYTTQTWPAIERDYVKTGKVRYVYKNFPIEQLHPNAFRAALAASCAGDQGRFPEMHARLFAHQSQLGAADLPAHARALGLDMTAFDACMAGTAHVAAIKEDTAEATAGGVRGTPVFVLAVRGPDPDVVSPVRVLVGAQPFDAFQRALDALLAQQQEN
ncbi:MAG: thioredoxin domain-containing protein [Vicinamibacterales bacterium]|nr:thioredoxin domain-containing protein [Vicinamibacterales bacterium]